MNCIVLDMDNTINNFFDYPDWLKWLRCEDVRPYRDCMPCVDMDELADVITLAQSHGIVCKVVSWGAKGSSLDYLKKVAQTKREWLKRYLPCELDEVRITHYGIPKQRYAPQNSVLVDDSPFVLSAWDKGQTIDAMNKDWLCRLRELVDIAISNE